MRELDVTRSTDLREKCMKINKNIFEFEFLLQNSAV
jgi:hypothetical protein